MESYESKQGEEVIYAEWSDRGSQSLGEVGGGGLGGLPNMVACQHRMSKPSEGDIRENSTVSNSENSLLHKNSKKNDKNSWNKLYQNSQN